MANTLAAATKPPVWSVKKSWTRHAMYAAVAVYVQTDEAGLISRPTNNGTVAINA